MKTFEVEVWQVTSYRVQVDAEDAEDAERQVKSSLRESHVRDIGGKYEDSWQDVMNAEEMTR